MLFRSGSNSITADMGSNNGIVGVKGVNSCGNSGTRTFNVVMNCREAGEGLANDAKNNLTLSPNPAVNSVDVRFNATSTSGFTVSVYDILGKKLLAESGVTNAGENIYHLNLDVLSKGIYVVEVNTRDFTSKRKLEIK